MKSKLVFLGCVIIFYFLHLSEQSKLRSAQIKFASTSSKQDKPSDANSQNQTNGIINLDTKTESKQASPENPKGEQEPKVHLGNCFMKLNNYFYDLYPLSRSDIIIKGKDGSYNNFNLCKNVETVCADKKGLFVNKEKCSIYSDVYTNDKNWQVESK